MLQACLNGQRTREDHPAVPITAEELAEAAAEAVAAGAGDLHLHPREGRGHDSLEPDVVAEVLVAVRSAVPGIPVGVTTGAWTGSQTQRVEAIGAWSVLPDHASVNWHEEGADQVAQALLEAGVQVDAGLWTPTDVTAWLAWPLHDRCARVLLELPDGPAPAGVAGLAEAMLAPLKSVVPIGRILLHGEGSTAWEALEYAGWSGLQTRVGLEDVLTLPDGAPASDNAGLVRAARSLLWQGYP